MPARVSDTKDTRASITNATKIEQFENLTDVNYKETCKKYFGINNKLISVHTQLEEHKNKMPCSLDATILQSCKCTKHASVDTCST